MSEQPQPKEIAFPRLFDRAMRILTQRDHSEAELRKKLQQSVQQAAFIQQSDPEIITEAQLDKVVGWCYENGWLNDARFNERFIGPQRIRLELGQKGIAHPDINIAMGACEDRLEGLRRAAGGTQIRFTLADRMEGESESSALFIYRQKVFSWRIFRPFPEILTTESRTGFYFSVKKIYLIPTFLFH